jgi:hypothetical protein
MKKLFLLFAVVLFAGSMEAAASSYRVNDEAIETVLSAATTVAFDVTATPLFAAPMGGTAIMADKNPWIAVVLAFFLGGIAIHRVYLGGTPVLILGYFITFFGIFGLIPFIDFIVLIINNQDISKYVGSNKFFMW